MKLTFKDKLIAEALNYYRIDKMLPDDDNNEYNDDDQFNLADDEQDYGSEDEFDDDMFADAGEEDADADVNALGDGVIDEIISDTGGGQDGEFDEDEDESFLGNLDSDEDNPDVDSRGNSGLIRTIKGAYMVYKRMTPENNYEELWIYNMKDVRYQTKIRNSILAGTDVDPVTLISPDGEQRADIYSKGNIQFVHIDGLPN
jgi:hypothetical protein